MIITSILLFILTISFTLSFIDWCTLKKVDTKEVRVIAKRNKEERITTIDDNGEHQNLTIYSQNKLNKVSIGDKVNITYQTSRWGWHNDWYLDLD